MDLDRFFTNLIKKWNEEKKCDSCWTWHGFTTLQGINNGVDGKQGDCCIKVFATNESFLSVNTYNADNPYPTKQECVESLSVWFLFEGAIELNCNDEEQLRKMKECLACDLNLEMCETMGFVFKIDQWRGESYRMYTDNNYWGWRVFMQIRS